jgi:hypothetical protein
MGKETRPPLTIPFPEFRSLGPQTDRKMTWSGGMPGGLFKGVRTFTLEPQGSGTTRITVREEYTGPLLPLIWRTMPDLGPSFEQFVSGLKKQAESESPG